jgi:hypothetical protein
MTGIQRSLTDIARQLKESQNRRYKASAAVLNQLGADLEDAAGITASRPKVVCLCGSTRFHEQFVEAVDA